MGEVSSWVDHRVKEATQAINNPGSLLNPGSALTHLSDSARESIGGFGNLASSTGQKLKDTFGSAAYNPVTAPLVMYGDSEQNNANIARGEDDAKEAERKYHESLQNIGSIATYQDLIAGNFRKNQDKYTGLLQDQDKRTLRNELADTLTNNKNDFNRRGLLQSGIRKYSDESNRAKTLSGIQEADFNNAQNVENQARDMELSAMRTNNAAAGAQTAGDLSDYQQALSNMQANNAMYSGFGNAAGTIAGSYLAQKKKGA